MNTFITAAPGAIVGLTKPEAQRAGLDNFVDAHVRNDQKELAFFRELSNLVTQKTGQKTIGPNSFLIPADGWTQQRRDMLASGSSGGSLIGLELAGFGEALRKKSVIGSLPVTHHQNLTANVTFTELSATSSTAWLADEGVTQAGATQGSFGQVSMTPHPIAATVVVSHQLLRMLGPGARSFLDRGLAGALAEAVDLGFMAGDGASGAPTGITRIAGIDTRTGSSFDLAAATAMLKVVEGRQDGASIAWAAGVNTAEILRKREAASGSGFLLVDNRMLGYPVVVSRSVPDNALAIAQWAAVHFGEWGSLEIGADAMTYFSTGRTILRALWRVDVAVERPGQIAVATAVS